MEKTSIQYENLEKSRNTSEQLSWYQELQRFHNSCELSISDMIAYFPIFASRQNISRFIETYEFYKLTKDIPGSFLELGVGSGSFLMALAHFCSIFEGYHYTLNW